MTIHSLPIVKERKKKTRNQTKSNGIKMHCKICSNHQVLWWKPSCHATAEIVCFLGYANNNRCASWPIIACTLSPRPLETIRHANSPFSTSAISKISNEMHRKKKSVRNNRRIITYVLALSSGNYPMWCRSLDLTNSRFKLPSNWCSEF